MEELLVALLVPGFSEDLVWRSPNDLNFQNILFCFENKSTPDPKSRLKFANMTFNDDKQVDKDLKEEKDRRLKLGDDDPLNVSRAKATKS